MVAFDWGSWRHGPITGTLHGITGLTAAAAIASLPSLDLTPGAVIGSGVLASSVVMLRSRYTSASLPSVVYRAGCWVGGSTWLAYVLTEGWSVGTVGVLVGGAAAAGALARPARARDRVAAQQRAVAEARQAAVEEDEAEQDRLHGVAGEWIRRLERVCRVKGCRVLGIEDWIWPGPDGKPRKTGYTLEVLLPTTGETWQTIAQYTDGLAAAADLPEGCPVEVGPGASKRRCLIEVSTLDALRDDIPYLPATEPGDIDAIPIGVVHDGSPAVVPMRYESTLLTGAKRSGKTNELLAIMGRVLECDNTLLCVIDYNGGAAATPWLAPWADRTIDRSPILWVADTPEEAQLLTSWLLAVIEFRKKHYHAANAARDDDKIWATPEVPQIILVTDEFGALGGQVKDNIWQINDRGGGAAVTTITCSLGSTSTYVQTELLAQLSNRIAMRVNEEKALGWLFEWQGGKGRPKPEDAPRTGYGHYRVAAGTPRVFKGPRIVPSVVRQVAVTTAAWRPLLDEATARMSPEWQRVFEQRWDRSEHLLAAAEGRPGTTGGGSGQGPVPAPRGQDAVPSEGGSAAERLGAAMEGLDAAAARLRDAMNQPRDPASDKAEFERIVAGEVVVPELVVRVLTVMGVAERMHTQQIAEKIGARVETLGHLLSQLGIRPLRNDFSIMGKRGRGYERAAVEAVAERIRAGELVPPDEVMRWRPEPPPAHG